MFTKQLAAIAMCCLFAGVALAQDIKVESNSSPSKAAVQPVKVMLDADGNLQGSAFLTDSKRIAPNVKVSLTADGKVVDAVETDRLGNFAFKSVAPGAYQMLGTADGYVGSQAYEVVPYAEPAIGSPCSLGMCGASSDVVYDSYASAPVSSFSSSCNSCNACGGGMGGGIGGRLGGGLLRNGRVGLIGLAGLAGLAGNDSSPDN